jgi:hypothetical protein
MSTVRRYKGRSRFDAEVSAARRRRSDLRRSEADGSSKSNKNEKLARFFDLRLL